MEIVLAYDKLEDVLDLVKEYTDMIIKQGGDDVKKCLNAQHIDDELADIQKKYALPNGRLYLLFIDKKAVGCAGLIPNDNDYCEIKRLYIRPEYRKRHFSQVLVNRIIEDAKTLGYKYMRLDTFPFMQAAIKLYEKYGFYYIERYNDNPAKTAVFMQLNL